MKYKIVNRISHPFSYVIIAVCFLAGLTWIFADKMNQIENHIYSIKQDVKKLSSYVEIPTIRTAEFHEINGFIVRLIPYEIQFTEYLDYFEINYKKASQELEMKPYFLTQNRVIKFHPKQWGQRLLKLSLNEENENMNDDTAVPLKI